MTAISGSMEFVLFRSSTWPVPPDMAPIGDATFAGDAKFEASDATSALARRFVASSTEPFSVSTAGSWFINTEGTMVIDFLVIRCTTISSLEFGASAIPSRTSAL